MTITDNQTVKFGLIRLVNPWRGLIWCCNLKLKHGILSARTGSKAKKTFEDWDIYFVHSGIEFYCGRSFSRQEFAGWFAAEVKPVENSPLEDLLDPMPANTPNPVNWLWYGSTVGQVNLQQEYKPTAYDFQKLCGYALSMSCEQFYPLLDPFEIWVCDKETFEPIALVITGNSLAEIDCLTYTPMVRFAWDFQNDNPLLSQLRTKINQAINMSDRRNVFRYYSRLFERKLDGTILEYRRKDPNDLTQLPQQIESQVELPDNWLCDRFWEEYQRAINLSN